MATILIIGGPQKGQWYYVTEARPLTLGRDEALLASLKDRRVSHHHLVVGYDPQRARFCADDLNSRNGVKINGHRINHRCALHHRDILCIGKTYLAFLEVEIQEASEAQEQMMEMRTRAESMHKERPSARHRSARDAHSHQSDSGSHGSRTVLAARQ